MGREASARPFFLRRANRMSWKKRPTTIETEKESTRAVFHIGLVMREADARQKARQDLGMERPERITFDDL